MATKKPQIENRSKEKVSIDLEPGAKISFGATEMKAASLSPKLQSILGNLKPSLESGGLLLVSIDADDKGGDDVAGRLLLWGSGVVDALLWDEELPPLPEEITGGLAGKISSNAKYAVIAGIIGIGVVQARLGTNRAAAIAFRYIGQVLTALLTTGIVPEPPASLKA